MTTISKPKPSVVKMARLLFACVCCIAVSFSCYAQPANDNCSNATVINIAGAGYSLGTFTSAKIDISKATIQNGETFVPSILGAKLNQKSVWFKFTLPTTRSVTVDLEQPQNGTITDGDVGYTVYKTSTCLPTIDSLSQKFTPHLIFGATSHICVDAATYYIQVSSNNKANGLVFVNLTVLDTTGALYDHPYEAFEFGQLPNFTNFVNFPVNCQSTDSAAEVCTSLSNYPRYTKSTWHTFKTPAYFDYLSVLIASPVGHFANGQATFGYNLYKGDAKTNGVSSLTLVDGCDSVVTDGYAAGYKIYECGKLKDTTTYTIQLFYDSSFNDNIALAVSYNGTAPTQAPQPILSLVPASNSLGILPYSPTGTNTSVTDHLGCNAHNSYHPCNPSLPAKGVNYNGKNYNLSTFYTFQLATQSNVNFYITNAYCGPPLLVRLFDEGLTNTCSSLDTSAHLIGEFLGNTNLLMSCLAAGKYTLQILGSDSLDNSNAYYYSFGSSNPLCLASNLGEMVNVSLNVYSVNASDTFALNNKNAYNAINAPAATMKPLQNGVIYQALPDTFGCHNTVLPAVIRCDTTQDKAMYREFVIGDANGDGKADSGIATISGYNGNFRYLLLKGNASSLATAQNAFAYPDTITGLTPYTDCSKWATDCYDQNNFCLVPGTYTLVTLAGSSQIGMTDQPSVQFNLITSLHGTPATAQNLGSIIDSVGANGTKYSDIDYFSCIDNAVTINGFAPPDWGYGHPATKAIYRQFYLNSASLVSIQRAYLYCVESGGVMALFSGKASDGLNTLAHMQENGQDWSGSNISTPACDPLAAGWYTIVWYGNGPSYTHPLQNLSEDGSGYSTAVGYQNQIYITLTQSCPAPIYNRPYKACVDSTTKKPFLLQWAMRTNGTAAYPVTDTTYTLYTENFNCHIDTPFNKQPVVGCDTTVNRIVYYVFQITKESYLQINTQGLWGEVFAADVRKDSAKFRTLTPVQPCLQSSGYIELCKLQPGTYTLVLFASDANVSSGCGNVTPTIYIDKTGYSRFDHANNAYDFGTLPADSIYHAGKAGDVNPLNAGRAPSNDFFYCTTGSQPNDPTESACSADYNANIYNVGVNNHLFDQSTPPSPWTIERRNLWYTFVVDKPGFVHVKVDNKSPDKTFQYPFAVYKSDVDGTLPFSKVVSTGQVDSTVNQGLSIVDYNQRYGLSYCVSSSDSIIFYRDPCTSSLPTRYYVLVDNTNSFPFVYPGMQVNSQVEVSIMLDSANAVPTKFDHYFQAYDINKNFSSGIDTGAVDNFSCATSDATDPVLIQSSCAPKTLWYKFTTSITGNVRFMSLVNGVLTGYQGNDIYLFRQVTPGDSTAAGMEYESASYYYDQASGLYWGEHCVSPGTYYLMVSGCGRLNETFRPIVGLSEDAGDFCSAPVVAKLTGPGSVVASAIVDCHTIGTDYGEFNPILSCPVNGVTTNYKSTWFRIDINGKDTLDITAFLVENTSDPNTKDIQYRLMTGDCGAMQATSCVQDALTHNTYKCLPSGSYYIQVFTPLNYNGSNVTGNIDLHLSAVPHADTCVPLQNCLASAIFQPQFDCNTGDSVRFINLSTYGDAVINKWDFGYAGKTSSLVSPGFYYPALSHDSTYAVTLVVTNTKCNKSDSYTDSIKVPARPHVNLGKDVSTCNGDTSIVLNAKSFNGATYYWQDGSTNDTYIANSRGYNQYNVTVSYNNCTSSDTVNVFISTLQKNPLQQYTACLNDSVNIYDGADNGVYINGNYLPVTFYWNTGATANSIFAKTAGTYWIDKSLNGCTVRDSFLVAGGNALIHPLGPDTAVCLAVPYNVDATVNNAYSYSWQDGSSSPQYSITTPGIYWVDISLGSCTFRDSVVITASNPPTPTITGDTAFCKGDSSLLDAGAGYAKYLWNNNDTTRTIYVKAPSTYNVTVFDNGGCSSVSKDIRVTENTITPPVIAGNRVLCYGDSLVLDAGTGYAKYIWSTGDTTETTKVKSAAKILLTVKSINNCSATDSVTVQQSPPPVIKNITSVICAGQKDTLPSGRLVSTAGQYTDTLFNTSGCDSLITNLSLVVNSPVLVDTSVTVCAGQTYTLPSGKLIGTTGTYNDTLKYAVGCDSLITTVNLTVLAVKIVDTSVSICNGQTYTLPSGKVLNSTGIYHDSLKSTLGCDSLITNVNLAVLAPKITDTSVTICAGQKYTMPSGKTASVTGVYNDTLRYTIGCDSLITNVNLTVLAATTVDTSVTVCAGQTYTLPSGKSINKTGTYNDTLKYTVGCDSLITTVNLTVLAAKIVDTSVSICNGQTYTLPSGKVLNTTGIYHDSLKSALGCDSLITNVNLAVLAPKITDTSVTICAGQKYTLPSGKKASVTGIYNDTLKYTIGCDSLITNVNLTVLSAKTVDTSITVCAGQIYTLPSGKSINQTGTYNDTLKYAVGCDSLITTVNFTVLGLKIVDTSASICNGQTYTLPSGRVESSAGVYKDTVKYTLGCDSLITNITLAVLATKTTDTIVTICAGQKYTLPSGKTASATGVYNDTIRYKIGCDSLITNVSLTVLAAKTFNASATICTGQTYTLPTGKQVSITGIYNDTLKYAVGCDSIITVLNLTVTPPLTLTVNASICAGNTYTLPGGNVASVTGTYVDTVKTSGGCDSVITTHLTVTASTPHKVAITICPGQTYTLPTGQVVSQAGVYSDTLITTNGCDSVIVTTLSIMQAVTKTTAASICAGDTYTLPWGGKVSTAGSYSDTLRSKIGCDSIIYVVSLTLKPKPVVSISKSNDVDCVIGISKLVATGGSGYLWSPAQYVDYPNVYNPVASPPATTVYHVVVTANNGCYTEDSIEVKVITDAAANGYQLPTAFTPNGDGNNDCFGVKTWGAVTNLNFAIYDRMGALMFSTRNPSECWDGTYKGIPQPPAAYVYMATAQTVCGKIFRKGTVVLVR